VCGFWSVDAGSVDAGVDCSVAGCSAGYVCKLANGKLSCVELTVGSTDAAPLEAAADAGLASDASRTDSRADAGGGTDAEAVDASMEGEVSVDADGVDGTADSSVSPDVISSALDAMQQDGPGPDVAADASSVFAEAAVGDDGGDGGRGAEGGAPACNADTDCVPSSERCVDGRCVPPTSLCSDGTQCIASGDRCVDGVCELPCSGSSPEGCPVGYACDTALGACALNPSPCAGSGPSTCPSGSVCVEQRCVAQCLSSEAGPACGLPGQVCVNGGCVPDEAAMFSCRNDGQTSELANVCANGSVCLHHDCYVECDATDDGGSACADPSQACKEVTVAAGTYGVCAPPNGLGSECDLAEMVACPSGHTCVDGYCE
jgi:hypothetical protein